MEALGYIFMYFLQGQSVNNQCTTTICSSSSTWRKKKRSAAQRPIRFVHLLIVLIPYTHTGLLPWQGLKAKTKAQKYEKISEKKLSTPVDELCKGQPGSSRYIG